MKVITPTQSNRVTAIEFSDAELLIIEAVLDDVSDKPEDERVNGVMNLWSEFNTLFDDLGLEGIEADGSDTETDEE